MIEEEVINESIAEIKQILGIIKSEIGMIDDKGHSKKQTKINPIDEGVRATILFTQRSYLDFYRKIADFIYNKLSEKAPDKDFFFYIPQLRTLIEIYSYLLYLCFQDEKRQMELIISNTLYTLSKSDSSFKTKEIQEQYALYYQSCKPFINREKLIFPENPNDFSGKWLKRSGYDYPHVDQRLKTEWIKESSPQYSFYTRNAEINQNYMYKHFSNYVHGNVLSKEDYGNEKFWIISETIILSGRIAELVNTKVLDNSKRKEIFEWIKRISKNRPKFVEAWKLPRNKINEERMIKLKHSSQQ
ncbi:MAG: hypothetical protein WA063_00205 [Minisyncoccia bacterium]